MNTDRIKAGYLPAVRVAVVAAASADEQFMLQGPRRYDQLAVR